MEDFLNLEMRKKENIFEVFESYLDRFNEANFSEKSGEYYGNLLNQMQEDRKYLFKISEDYWLRLDKTLGDINKPDIVRLKKMIYEESRLELKIVEIVLKSNFFPYDEEKKKEMLRYLEEKKGKYRILLNDFSKKFYSEHDTEQNVYLTDMLAKVDEKIPTEKIERLFVNFVNQIQIGRNTDQLEKVEDLENKTDQVDTLIQNENLSVREKRKEIDEAIAGLQSDSSKLYDVIASLQPIGEMFNMGKKTKKHLARLLEQMQKELDANKLKETDKMIIKNLYL